MSLYGAEKHGFPVVGGHRKQETRMFYAHGERAHGRARDPVLSRRPPSLLWRVSPHSPAVYHSDIHGVSRTSGMAESE